MHSAYPFNYSYFTTEVPLFELPPTLLLNYFEVLSTHTPLQTLLSTITPPLIHCPPPSTPPLIYYHLPLLSTNTPPLKSTPLDRSGGTTGGAPEPSPQRGTQTRARSASLAHNTHRNDVVERRMYARRPQYHHHQQQQQQYHLQQQQQEQQQYQQYYLHEAQGQGLAPGLAQGPGLGPGPQQEQEQYGGDLPPEAYYDDYEEYSHHHNNYHSNSNNDNSNNYHSNNYHSNNYHSNNDNDHATYECCGFCGGRGCESCGGGYGGVDDDDNDDHREYFPVELLLTGDVTTLVGGGGGGGGVVGGSFGGGSLGGVLGGSPEVGVGSTACLVQGEMQGSGFRDTEHSDTIIRYPPP